MDGFDIGALDDVIHGRIRLGIMAYLSTARSADFGSLKTHLATTDGNLSVHAKKLEEAGYVQVEKTYAGRKPLTRLHITDVGHAAFVAYLDAISRLVAKP